ncbi:MAG: hypothetical protein ACRD29_24465 [Acidimicrobiales bacterium]
MTPATTLPDGPTGSQLVFVGGELVVYDLDTGVRTELDVIEGQGPSGVVTVPTGIVVVDGRGAVFVSEFDVTGEPVLLGGPSGLIASDEPDRVWLVDGGPYGPVSDGATVREVDTTGRETVASVTMPPGIYPVGPVTGGLVLNSPDGVFVLDRDGSSRRAAPGTGIGTFGSRVVHRACDNRLVCHVHVTDVRNGRTRAVPDSQEVMATPDFYFFGSSFVSPDGELLASLSYVGEETFGVQLSVVDLDHGDLVLSVPPEIFGGNPYYPTVAWSPDGDWLFVPSSVGIRAFRMADRVMVELDALGDGALVVVDSRN